LKFPNEIRAGRADMASGQRVKLVLRDTFALSVDSGFEDEED
jgi:hypothetical protein